MKAEVGLENGLSQSAHDTKSETSNLEAARGSESEEVISCYLSVCIRYLRKKWRVFGWIVGFLIFGLPLHH